MNKSNKTIVVNSEEKSDSGNPSALVYKYKDINFDNIEVSELQKEGKQPLAYINYDDSVRNAKTKILVQTGKIKLTSHGIPQLSKEGDINNYYPNDSVREFIKIPLDPEQLACVELRKHIEAADEWAGSTEMRKKLFGKKAVEYQYQSSIRTPKKCDDDDDDKPKKGKNSKSDFNEKKVYPIIDYVKMKFNVAVQDNVRINKTKLNKIEGTTKKPIKADTITEIANEIKYLSEIRLIFYYNKIWANKSPSSPGGYKIYGIGFKIMAIEYTSSSNRGLGSADINFLSDEEDDENGQSNISPKKNKTTNKFDDSDVDDNEDDNKSKTNETKGNVKEEIYKDKSSKKDMNKKSKKSKDENEEEANEDEDEEAEMEADENDNEDENKEIKSKKKGTSKKSKKSKDENEDENEDESQDVKPTKKSGKTKSSRSK